MVRLIVLDEKQSDGRWVFQPRHNEAYLPDPERNHYRIEHGLKSNQLYQVMVSAVTAAGEGPASTAEVKTLPETVLDDRKWSYH